jgi:hypothetical protein
MGEFVLNESASLIKGQTREFRIRDRLLVATSVKMQALVSHIHHYITEATLCFIFNHQFTQQHVQTSDYKGKRNEASRVSSYPRGYNSNGTKKNEVSCGSTVFFQLLYFAPHSEVSQGFFKQCIYSCML